MKWLGSTYKLLGCLIVALPLAIWLLSPSNWKFWAESAAIWVFGCYWWLKTHELEAIFPAPTPQGKPTGK